MNKQTLQFCILVFLSFKTIAAFAAEVAFERDFAPQGGLVSPCEEPFRQEICLNGSWRFQGDQNTSIPAETPSPPGAWEVTAIKIPSPWNVNSFSMNLGEQGGDFVAYPTYPKAWEKVPAAWMEKSVTVPSNWADKRIILHFGAVAGDLVVYVNGQRAGEGIRPAGKLRPPRIPFRFVLGHAYCRCLAGCFSGG